MEKREFASISLYLKGRMRRLDSIEEPSRFSGFGLSDSAIDAEELKSIKAQLVSEHVRYTDNNDRENRL